MSRDRVTTVTNSGQSARIALHGHRRFRDICDRHPLGRCEDQCGFDGLFHAFGERDRGNAHFLRDCKRHEIDDELVIQTNVRARILGFAGYTTADSQTNRRGSEPNTLKKEKGAALIAPLPSHV